MTDQLSFPILALCANHTTYMRFVRLSELNANEAKQIKNLDDLRGYKDKLIMVIERELLTPDLLDYAKGYNIRMVYHDVA